MITQSNDKIWKGIQWPGFSIVLPIKVFSSFLAMPGVHFWCIHAKGKQTREMDTALSNNAVLVFCGFLTRCFVICQFFLRYCGIGYPLMSLSLMITIICIVVQCSSLPLRTVRVILSRTTSSGQHSDMWQSVLDYWFSSGDPSKWFRGGPQVDKEIKEKFGSLVSYFLLSYSLINLKKS